MDIKMEREKNTIIMELYHLKDIIQKEKDFVEKDIIKNLN